MRNGPFSGPAGGDGVDAAAGDSCVESPDPSDATTLKLSGPPDPDHNDGDGAECEEEEAVEHDPENDSDDGNDVD